MEKYKITYQGKEIEIERLPNGKFKIPPLGQFTKHGLGSTWLDNGRIPIKEGDEPYGGYGDEVIGLSGFDSKKGAKWKISPTANKGRFPANLCVEDDVLDDGKISSSGRVKPYKRSTDGLFHTKGYNITGSFCGDSGLFSRYFSLDSWFSEKIKQLPKSVQKTFPFLICPKASKSEKDKYLEIGKSEIDTRTDTAKGSMTEKGLQAGRNIHPTVKPLKLISYLVTLGSREGDIILDPFVGSGTTALACKMLGRRCIGMEIEEKYCEIAAKRCSQGVFKLNV